MPGPGPIAALGALLALISTPGCGGPTSSDSSTVVHVRGVALTKGAVDRSVRVLSGGRTAQPTGAAARTLRNQALNLLISEQWLIGEAARRGLSISGGEVREQLARTQGAEFPGGPAELREFLRSTGQTVSDLERRAKSEVASEKLRRQAIAGAPAVTKAQISLYYAEHKHRYLILEERKAYFNNMKSRSEAIRLKHEVEAGKRELISPSQREVNEIFASAHVPPGNEYETAIDSSKPHTVSGPYEIGNDFWLYEVVKIIPARQRTLGEVAAAIRRQLTQEREKTALARFAERWTASWRAKTDCSPGYVIPRCKQYRNRHAGVQTLPNV